MKIRRMKPDDISAVAAIEKVSFSRPWSEEMIYRDLTSYSRAYFYVAEEDGEIFGHIAIWKSPDSIHLTTLAVLPSRRRQGIASALVKKVLAEQSSERSEIVLEVRESNQPALGLYRKFGFEVKTRRFQYYADNGEDALVMVCNCNRKSEGAADATTGKNTGSS